MLQYNVFWKRVHISFLLTNISSFLSQILGSGDSWSEIDPDSLNESIVEGWNKSPQKIIDKCIDAFKPLL